MATRSNIGIRESDGTIRAVYCHYDGYPSNNGRILLDHYTNEVIVRELVAGGNMSSLHPTPSECEVYDPREEAMTIPPGGPFRTEEYAYLFDVPTQAWLFKALRHDNFIHLTRSHVEE